ncbi:hypothetical protein V7S43_013206 [Phytophthora oleae]|uniref:Uncharacterized protein n=1 Tax=Phytophthora oleae TaxID=2107226 RepID=A0ABD3F5B7_9STRA
MMQMLTFFQHQADRQAEQEEKQRRDERNNAKLPRKKTALNENTFVARRQPLLQRDCSIWGRRRRSNWKSVEAEKKLSADSEIRRQRRKQTSLRTENRARDGRNQTAARADDASTIVYDNQ